MSLVPAEIAESRVHVIQVSPVLLCMVTLRPYFTPPHATPPPTPFTTLQYIRFQPLWAVRAIPYWNYLLKNDYHLKGEVCVRQVLAWRLCKENRYQLKRFFLSLFQNFEIRNFGISMPGSSRWCWFFLQPETARIKKDLGYLHAPILVCVVARIGG